MRCFAKKRLTLTAGFVDFQQHLDDLGVLFLSGHKLVRKDALVGVLMDGCSELFVCHLGEEVFPKLPYREQAAVAESFFVAGIISGASHALLHVGFVDWPPQHVEGLVADAVDFHGVEVQELLIEVE